MTPVLALHMENRGRTAWGCTDGDYIHRCATAISESFQELFLGAEHGVIYHTRAPSCGSNTIPNTHPFDFTGSVTRIIGIHNGHIGNHDDLDRKYSRSFAVDSMHIFKHLADGLDMSELAGYGTVAWYDVNPKDPEDRVLHLSHWGHTALHVAKLKTGEVVFASTDSAIKAAIRYAGAELLHFYAVDPKTKYSLTEGELTVHGKIPFGEKAVYVPAFSAGRAFYRGSRAAYMDDSTWSDDDLCAIPGCRHYVDRKKTTFCTPCVKHYDQQYGIGYFAS